MSGPKHPPAKKLKKTLKTSVSFSPSIPDDLLELGRVGHPHGVGGIFVVHGRKDPLPPALKHIFIGAAKNSCEKFSVTDIYMFGKGPAIKCSGLSSRNDVEKWQGALLWMSRAELTVQEDSEFLWRDVVGRGVVDASGVAVGTIAQVYETPAHLVMMVKKPEGLAVDIPFIAPFVEMSFAPSGKEPLQLKVTEDYFEGLWVLDKG